MNPLDAADRRRQIPRPNVQRNNAMKPATNHFIVLVTAPNLKTARRLAQAALKAKLIACANLVPGVESHYWWQGKLEQSGEVLMVLKAGRRSLPKLEKLILKLHSYDTAEFIVLPLRYGTDRYLTWWEQSCRA